MNVDIDTIKLQDEINKLRQIDKEMETLKNDIKKDTEDLKLFWNTKTSESVQESFQDFYNDLENLNIKNDLFASYLERVVSEQYEKSDSETNKLVDDNIAV
jgi:uncharacterized protein YukE